MTTGGAVTTLNWNAAGMLSGIAYPGGNTNTFTYNGLKQRVGKSDSTGNFAYTLPDDSIDATPLSDGAAVYRQAVGLLGEVRGSDKRYYNSDSLGSTRAIADATGTVSATKETDAFGNVWTPGTTGTQTPFGFAGQHGYQTDADSGLQKLGYRYYDASTGRFLSRDPIQDGRNWYVYCDNNPISGIDPSGLQRGSAVHANGSAIVHLADGTGTPWWIGVGELPKPTVGNIPVAILPIKDGIYPIDRDNIPINFHDFLIGNATGHFIGNVTVKDGAIASLDGKVFVHHDVYDTNQRPMGNGDNTRNVLTGILDALSQGTGAALGTTPQSFDIFVDGYIPIHIR